ncbi:MAG TPA: LacI family DNA-binding transcriptional regulator [Armatimonadota bacterium]|nr:LacI family DNA-binding transcriptional regulator [Armatimonadota bacterium]
MVSLKEIAKEAQVAPSTVSIILNGRSSSVRISPATVERVKAIATRMGYSPNRVARALSMGSTMQIALWVPHLKEPYYAEILDTIFDNLKASGYDMMVSDAYVVDGWQAHLARLAQWPVDGIIACDCPAFVDAYITLAGNRRKPIVSVGANFSNNVDTVALDLYTGEQNAVEHLLSQGRKHIACILPQYGFSEMSDPRHRAYADKMKQYQLHEEYLLLPDYTPYTAYKITKDYLTTHTSIDAIICFNDDMALGAHRAIMELGIDMPGRIALIGHNGIRDCDYVFPRLSTIVHPRQQMCELAWKVLQDRIAYPKKDKQQFQLTAELSISASANE